MALEEIIARLGIDDENFKRGIAAAGNATKGLRDEFVELGSRIAQVFTVGAFLNLAKEAVQYASDVSDSAAATRTQVEAYQVLSALARESGASIQQLDQALIKSTLSGEKAAEGNREMSAAFRALGIDVTTFNNLPTEQKLETIGRAYNDAGASQEAYAAITEILGTKSAPRLIEALQTLGRDGVEATTDKFQKMGLVLSELNTMKLDRLSDQFANFKVGVLIYMAEAVEGVRILFDAVKNFSFDQASFEAFDPARADPAVRAQAIQELAEQDAAAYNARMQQLGPMVRFGFTASGDSLKQSEDEEAIQQRIVEILRARAVEENRIAEEKAAAFRQSQATSESEQRTLDVEAARRAIAEGQALIQLQEMTGEEKLNALAGKRLELMEELELTGTLIYNGTKTTEQVKNEILKVDREIASTQTKMAADEAKANDEREKKQLALLDLIKEQARLQGLIDSEAYNRYGRDSGDLASGGGSNSTLGRLASEEQRLAEQAQRQFDELARARARAAGGDEDAARELERLQNQFEGTEAERRKLEDQITGAQGGKTGDPLVDKMEDVRKEIEEMREGLKPT